MSSQCESSTLRQHQLIPSTSLHDSTKRPHPSLVVQNVQRRTIFYNDGDVSTKKCSFAETFERGGRAPKKIFNFLLISLRFMFNISRTNILLTSIPAVTRIPYIPFLLPYRKPIRAFHVRVYACVYLLCIVLFPRVSYFPPPPHGVLLPLTKQPDIVCSGNCFLPSKTSFSVTFKAVFSVPR